MGETKRFLDEHLRPMSGPYLFVGAGFSRRYARLPSWVDLLAVFSERTGMSLEYYLSRAGGNLPLAATGIAEAFHEKWWRDDEYEASRISSQGRVHSRDSPLKIEISAYLETLLQDIDVPAELSHEFNLLQMASVDGIITTNYDRLLSIAFPTFEVFVGQEGLLFADTQGIAEIYAIHGATSDPESLVLTSEDYAAYEDRNAYLASKLMTIFVEHPVIFLGYSFNDPNVYKMLTALVQGLKDKSVEKLQDRLIFVEWQAGTEASIVRTQMLVGGHLLPIIRLVVPDWQDVFAALGERKHALPARTLRYLKEQVFDIVKSNDPKGLLYAVSDIDSVNAKDVSIVFGVGAKLNAVGIVGLGRKDILQDVLAESSAGYPAVDLLEKIVQKVPRGTWYPLYKYLRQAGHLDVDGSIIDRSSLEAKLVDRYDFLESQLTTTLPGVAPVSMAAIQEEHDSTWIFSNALALPAYTHDAEGLRTYLTEHFDKYHINSWWAVQFVKAVISYEKLRFGGSNSEQ